MPKNLEPGLPDKMALSRRRLLQIGGVAALAVPLGGVLSSCGGGSSSVAKEVIWAGYGGTYNKEMKEAQFKPFEKDSGIEVKETTGADDVQKIRTMVEAKQTAYDVIDMTGPAYGQLLSMGLLQKMNTEIVHPEGLSDPEATDAYTFPQFSYAHCVFWNSDHFDEPMSSWKDVWDVDRFPGKRGFQKQPYYLLEEALMADGVAPSDIYPLDLDRGIRMLDKIRPHAVFQDLNTIQNLVAQGDVVTGDLNLARVQTLVDGGAQLKYDWNQAIVDYVRWGVPKAAPHTKNGWKLIDATLNPERQLEVLKRLAYTPTLKSALDKIDPKKRADLAGTPETLKASLVLDPKYYAEHGAEASKAVQNWLVKG